jgi:hypothetical protein
LRRITLPFALTLVTLAATGAGAADLTRAQIASAVAVPPTLLPAVSGVNGSLDVAGGFVNGKGALGTGGYGHLGGSLSVPVGARYGVQVDGLAAAIEDLRMIGAGGHAFWRDPGFALIGIYGEGLAADVGDDTLRKGRFGAETEVYFDRVTLSGVAGYEWGNLDIRNGVFAEVQAGYYITDDLKISAGYGYGFAGNMATARAEWQVPAGLIGSATSLYGEARFGEGGYASVLTGVKLQFGTAPKSLKQHEREDDPPVWIKSQPHAIASAKAQGQFDKPATADACSALVSSYESLRTSLLSDGFTFADYNTLLPYRTAAVSAGCSVSPMPGF